MTGYMIRRFLLMILTLFGMSILIFVMLRLVPGNISDILFDSAGFVDPAEKARLERELGLDQPILIQYWQWISGLMRGDLGFAYVSEQPAWDEIAPRIPITAKLAGLALFFSVLFGVPLGVISAVRQDTWLDYILRVVSLSGLSLPSFWLGLLVLTAFVHWFGWITNLYGQTGDALGRTRAAQHTGCRGRFPIFRTNHAIDPIIHAGGHAPGLYSNGPGERCLRDERQLRSCAS